MSLSNIPSRFNSGSLSLLSSVLETSLISQIKTSKNRSNHAYPRKIKNMLEELPTIDIEDIDVELMTDNLKPEHRDLVKVIYSLLLEDEEITEVNKFEDWTNQFLGQLLYVAAKTMIKNLVSEKDLIANNPRFMSVNNDIDNLSDSLVKFSQSKIIRLLSAEETNNNYPISREGITFMKEFNSLRIRYSGLREKIRLFKNTQK